MVAGTAADFLPMCDHSAKPSRTSCARNLGVECSVGDTIIFIDSDLVVTPNFLQAHAQSRKAACQGSERVYLCTASSTPATSIIPQSLQADGFFSGLILPQAVVIARHWLEKLGSLTPAFNFV